MSSSDSVGAGAGQSHRWKTVATVLLVLVLLWPAVGGGDGVPLSSYPMYAQPREAVLEFIVPVAVTSDGGTESLSTRVTAATNDPLVAESFLRDEVKAGRSVRLCEQIAARVEGDNIVRVEIRAERHDVVERVRANAPPIDTTTVASCPA